MLNFDDILKQYEPMISAFIRKLNIHRNHDSFRQAGRVALWQAWNRFDVTKGNFTPFAYRSIRGSMLDELKRESQFEENVILIGDKSLEYIIEPEFAIHYGLPNRVVEALDNLSPAEQELVRWLIIEGFTLQECARRVGISVAGIKKRRQRILGKLRSELVGG
ncbi:MAG: sigma-70 family RNA polymerase sigma factor [Sporosarcina sp.]